MCVNGWESDYPLSVNSNESEYPKNDESGNFNESGKISSSVNPGGGGVLPYMGYIGMCGPKGYGFSAVLVINRVLIFAILPPLWS